MEFDCGGARRDELHVDICIRGLSPVPKLATSDEHHLRFASFHENSTQSSISECLKQKELFSSPKLIMKTKARDAESRIGDWLDSIGAMQGDPAEKEDEYKARMRERLNDKLSEQKESPEQQANEESPRKESPLAALKKRGSIFRESPAASLLMEKRKKGMSVCSKKGFDKLIVPTTNSMPVKPFMEEDQ